MNLEETKKMDALPPSAPASACPLCARTSVIREAVRWKEGTFTLCRNCGFLFQDPPPSASVSRAFYEKDYYAALKEAEARIRAARQPLYGHVLARMRDVRKTGRILDVGSGFGDFLRAAQDAGWEAWGLEPSLEACEEARASFGERVVCGTTDEADFAEGFFDVITLWNVLDCLPDPAAVVARLRQWLRPGGVLVIRTPNAFLHLNVHRIYKTAQPLWNRLGWKKDAAVFLRSNFSAKTARLFLTHNGFRIACMENGLPTTGDPYGVFARSGFLGSLKNGVLSVARAAAWVSGGRVLLGPNLLIFAAREEAGVSTPDLAGKLAFRIGLKRAAIHLLAVLGYLMGLPLWFRIFGDRRQIPVLLYHSVTEGQPGEMSVSREAFQTQMKFLKRHYRVIPAADALRTVRQNTFSEKPSLAITFDDGYQDNFTTALPVLKALELPATIFLLTGGGEQDRRATHLGHAQAYYPETLLSWEQVREMIPAGITFGSHGESHARLGSLTPEQILREMRNSKLRIERETGKPVDLFSYPYGTSGDFDSRAIALAREAGYEGAFSAIFGANTAGTDGYVLKRMSVEAGDSLFTLRAKLNGALALLSVLHWSFFRALIRQWDRVFLGLGTGEKRKAEPILLASVDFPPHTDGVSTIAGELSSRIAARRPEFFILGPKDDQDQAYDRERHYRPMRVPGYDWGYARVLPFAAAMPYLILRRGIRRVFALNIAYGGLMCWLLSFPLKLRYVLFAYGYEFEKVKASPFLRKLYLAIYSRSEKVICCSEAVRERLHAFGVPENKTVTLYPAVDLARYQPANVPEAYRQKHAFAGRRVILTVGRLVERKGHDLVLRALKKLVSRYPEVLYCISGKGDQEARLRELTRELGLEGHVRFMGRVSDEELIHLYNQCEFFIMPSREIQSNGHIEGFGIVYLEANAFGKPVIGGRSGGVMEAVKDGYTGLLSDPFSEEDIALKMEILLAKPDYARELGRNGLEWVRTRFQWDAYSREAYRFLMGEELP